MTPAEGLRHVVLFRLRPDTTEAESDELVRRFAVLQQAVPGVIGFEWGRNTSPEGLDEGVTHCFTLTFESDEARDAYLPHPEHQAFVEWAGPWIEQAVVVDYWTTTIG